MKRITESDSSYDNLEEMKLSEILTSINKEDQTVPLAVAKAIPSIERLVQVIVENIQDGGRFFSIGAGTSGRLGRLDASRVTPPFGLDHDPVKRLITEGKK